MMPKLHRAAPVFALLVLAACREAAPETTAPVLTDIPEFTFAHEVGDLPVDPAITYGTLDNGLRYALRANATPTDTASLYMYVDAGSLDETDDTRGLAHFLEHMAFNGSDLYPEGEMVKSLERLGLAFGADTNAYTTYDRTVYTLQLPNLTDPVVSAALGAMRETASNLTLAPAAIAAERGVIQSELRARKSPASRAQEASLAFWLDGTPFPERLPIGTQATIDGVTGDQFRAFYDGRYRPKNTAIVMVGDFDVADMEARIRNAFADWNGQGEAAPIARPDTFPDREPRVGTFTDPEVTTSVDAAVFRPYTKPLDTQAARAEALLDSVGNALLNRRFQRLSVEGSRDFLGASAATYPLFDIAETSTLSVSSGPDDWAPALTDAVVELNKARTYCFTQAELDEYLANSRRAYERSVETSATRRTSGLANSILGALVADRVVTTPESSLARYTELEPRMTLDEICPRFEAAWEGFDAADLFFTGSAAPEPAAIRDAFAAAMATEVVADADRGEQVFAYADWGTPGQVANRARVDDIGFTTVDFENGVRLNIKRTDYAKDQVIARASIGGGLQNTDWPEGFGTVAGAVLGDSGLGKHTVDALRTLSAGRNAYAGMNVGTRTVQISGGSSSKDMDRMFDLMLANLTDKAYRETSIRTFRRDLAAFYDTLDSTPGGVAARDVPRLLRSGDARFGIPSQDTLASLDETDIRDTLEPLLESGLIEIGVVGDVDPDRVIAEVARTFGTLPTRVTTLPDTPDAARTLAFPDAGEVTLTHAGDADTATYQVVYPAPGYSDPADARRVGIARRIAQLKLTEVLREREGQSYSPSVGDYIPRAWLDYGYVSVGVNADPAELDAIAALVDEVAADMREGRITDDEFARAITPVREGITKSLEQNGYWLGVIGRARTFPEDLADHRTRIPAYEAMTREDILPVARDIFDEGKAYRIRIVPEDT